MNVKKRYCRRCGIEYDFGECGHNCEQAKAEDIATGLSGRLHKQFSIKTQDLQAENNDLKEQLATLQLLLMNQTIDADVFIEQQITPESLKLAMGNALEMYATPEGNFKFTRAKNERDTTR